MSGDRDPPRRLSRRAFLAASGAGAAWGLGTQHALAAASPRAGSAERLRLMSSPTRVYKLRDPGREDTESWLFNVIVETAVGDAPEPAALSVAFLSRGQVLETTSLGRAALATLRVGATTRSVGQAGEPLAAPVAWQAYRIRGSRPVAAQVDEVRLDMQLHGEDEEPLRAALRVPIGTYTPRTSLVFPFRERGYISNAHANDGGHRNRSGQFALDALGVDARYAPVASGEDVNGAYTGWGREIVAPGAGTVVVARADRPDQPVTGKSDPAFFAPEYPNGGDMGNHVVIDHGNGEFSLMAHMMAGSVVVAAGESVVQGQPVGRLGNSGDTNGPHLHYQLQAGPHWETADALPCRFSNVSVDPLIRGTFFRAE